MVFKMNVRTPANFERLRKESDVRAPSDLFSNEEKRRASIPRGKRVAMRIPLLPMIVLGGFGIGVGPLLLRADMIQGTMCASGVKGMTCGSTVSGIGPDDLNTSTTSDIQALSVSGVVASAIDASAFNKNNNFVFAGTGVAADIRSIDPGDFTVNLYTPWVVSNFVPENEDPSSGINYVVGPDGNNYGRKIHNKDAGGVNFVLSYQPQFNDEPTLVNFIQVLSHSFNGVADPPFIDTPSLTGTPYYNDGAVAGSGTSVLSGTLLHTSQVPLSSSKAQAAWILDIPFVMEDSPNDEAVTSYSATFYTFIESTQTLKGQACTDGQAGCYNILYGGVKWGYTYTAVDTPTPESSSMLLLTVALTMMAGMLGYCRRQHSRLVKDSSPSL
jgi:hypothetical protein